MKKKLSDEKLIALMQNLPRVKAPENFEYNLMTRIKNRNFGGLEKEENNNLLWAIIPSAGIVTVAVVVLMFMFSSIENEPSLAPPQKIAQSKAKTFVVIKNKDANEKGGIEAVKIVKATNDVVTKQKIVIPVTGSKGLQLDNYLNKSIENGNSSATLVSSEEEMPFMFREFLPYTEIRQNKKNVANSDSVVTKIFNK